MRIACALLALMLLPAGAQTPASAPVLRAAAGLRVSVFAREKVRGMTMGPDGAVYATKPSAGQVVRIVDSNGDGVADSTTVVLDHLNQPHDLMIRQYIFYVANADGIVRVGMTPRGPGGWSRSIFTTPNGGFVSTRHLAIGGDGRLYLTVGASCDVCVETDTMRGTIMQLDFIGGRGRVFARGIRSAIGIAVEPQTRTLWVTSNERDHLGASLPPDAIRIVHDGDDFGWPACYSLGGKLVPDTTLKPGVANPSRCATATPAALELPPHSVPLGITFLRDATQLPSEYRGDALVALHGAGDGSMVGDKVIRVRVKDGKPVGVEDFVTGWQSAPGKRLGRPATVLVYKDGSILIADDAAGVIYRVSK